MDRTIPSGQDVATVPLSANDPDGDPITFTATAQSLAYVLDRELGLTSNGDEGLNWGGRAEIKPSEISPDEYRAWAESVGLS